MTVDVVLATFSVTQLVLSLGAALIAFSLRRTFQGGIFERAWRIIAIAPTIYAVGQAIRLAEAIFQESTTMESLGSLVQVVFLVVLVTGLFTFATAWSRKPKEGEGNYATKAKGALVFFMGHTGASAVLLYTGEPKAEDFEDKLGRVLGKRASTIIQHTTETGEAQAHNEKRENRAQAFAGPYHR